MGNNSLIPEPPVVDADSGLEDPRVFAALTDYLAQIEAGVRPDRESLLAAHADIADRLVGCLDAMELVQGATSSAGESLPYGTIIGGFRILREVGRGGMGIVYLACDASLNRFVALKVMKPLALADELARKRFLREAQSAATLRHDHVITVHQAGEDQGVPFLAMEFLYGESLEQRLRQGALPLAETLSIARQAADGLAAAHERGLVHRDIKPANLFLERNETATPAKLDTLTVDPIVTPKESSGINGATVFRVKILDFGLARLEEPDGHGELTRTGVVIGTPQYMAPEQAAGDPVDQRADLFSLGCVLYRMLTGVVPFKGDNLRAAFRAVMLEPPTSPRQLNPAVPKAVEELVLRLLAKEPGQRFQSAREVSEALRALEVAVASASATLDSKTTATATKPSHWRGVQVALMALALALIATVCWYALWRLPEAADSKPDAGRLIAAPKADAALPFVVLQADQVNRSEFATLTDALRGAKSGDTIEIHGNGPFVYDSLSLSGKSLVLRAGPGFRPVLQQKADAKTDRLSDPFLFANRSLVLEGLEFQRFSSEPAKNGWQGNTLVAKNAPLYVTHCRFVNDTLGNSHVLNASGWHCEVRNSLLLTRRNAGFGQVLGDRMGKAVFHNNLFFSVTHPLRVSFPDEYTHDFAIIFAKNTLIGQGLDFALITEPKPPADGSDKPRVYVEATDNITDPRKAAVPYVICFSQHQAAAWNQPGARLMPTAEAEVYFRKRVNWKEQRNLYPSGVRLFGLFIGSSDWTSSTLDVLHLANWNKFMGLASTGSTQGPILYQNKGLPTNLTKSLLELTPTDFRLAPGGTGKGMDKDGNDAGADVDQVGPGQAYEAWKLTADYQKWLKETGQKN